MQLSYEIYNKIRTLTDWNFVSFHNVIHFGMCTLNCSFTLMRCELVVNFSDLGVIVDRQFNEDISSNSIKRACQDFKLDVRLHEEGNSYTAESMIPLYKPMWWTLSECCI